MEALSIVKLAKTAEYLQLEQHFGTETKIGFQIQIIMAPRDKKNRVELSSSALE